MELGKAIGGESGLNVQLDLLRGMEQARVGEFKENAGRFERFRRKV
jgi:hypothetical protein